MANSAIPRDFQEFLRPHLPYADTEDLAPDDDLASLGLDSMSIVQMLYDMEDQYGVELPDDLLTEATFATVGSFWAALCALLEPTGSAA